MIYQLNNNVGHVEDDCSWAQALNGCLRNELDLPKPGICGRCKRHSVHHLCCQANVSNVDALSLGQSTLCYPCAKADSGVAVLDPLPEGMP